MTNHQVSTEEMNILILGESGVGKSTFINSFANYLSHNTLEVAEQKEIVALIPTTFAHIDEEDYEETQVKFGDDPNESGIIGKSQTQSCRSYTFQKGAKLVRIIDTPGIGDTLSLEKDTINFENVISYISNYSVLHGICILMKPNSPRLSVMFRFCITKLLSHIHKDASKNIVFLFTHSRGSRYTPADSLPTLRTLLKEIATEPPHVEIPTTKATMYCLDNESFRYLLGIKKGIIYSGVDKMNFKTSWDKSVSECVRLLDHFSKIKPHNIHDTVSLNDARSLVALLANPLCDINKNVKINILAIENQERKIQQAGEDIAKLQKAMRIPFYKLEHVFFQAPRFVCTTGKCTSVRTVGDKSIVVYSQDCPVPRQRNGLFGEIVYFFRRINGDTDRYCKQCSCESVNHRFINHENRVVHEETNYSEVLQKIENQEQQKLEKTRVLQECQIRREKWELEQDLITRACAKFAHFMKCSAISPYNDAFKDYLNHLIEEEKRKCGIDSDNQRTVDELEKMKGAYEEQVKILESNCNSPIPIESSYITPTMINDTMTALYALEFNGSLIRNDVETLRGRRQAAQKKRERMYQPVKYHAHGVDNGFSQEVNNKLQDFI